MTLDYELFPLEIRNHQREMPEKLGDTCACGSMCKYVMLFEDRKGKKKQRYKVDIKTLCCYGLIFTAENHIIALIDWGMVARRKKKKRKIQIVCNTDMIVLFVGSPRKLRLTF